MNERAKHLGIAAGLAAVGGFFFLHEDLAKVVFGIILAAYGLAGAARRRIRTFQKLRGFVVYEGVSAVFEGLLFALFGFIIAWFEVRRHFPFLLGPHG